MPNIGDAERITQNRVIKFFHEKLHYTYLGDLSDKDNSNVIVDLLRKNLLARGYSEGLTEKAIVEFLRRVIDLSQDLYKANEDIYSYLKYGIKVAENAGESPKTVYLIDFDDLTKNDYYVAEEVSIPGDHTKRPDVVVYINGIAIAVIELKKSTVSVSNGIRQNLTNQKAHFIRPFFSTIQFCMAGNDSEGLRYGTILTPEKHYLEWRQDDYAGNPDELDESDLLIRDTCAGIENKLDSQIYAMFYKKRFLDLIHNFIIFDKGIKKVCRYNQYYAIKREELNYIRYFCGENGVDDDSDEAFSRSREKLYRLVSRLSRAYAEVKQYMDKIGYTADQRAKFENRVSFYIQLKDTIGRASADFIDLKMYEPGMRYLIDNYIEAGNATKLEIFEDFTLLDFILSQEEKLDTDAPDSPAESAAEAIENNIRKKIVQKIIINPAYYGKMSEVLEQLIFDRKKGAVQYKQLLQKYIELAKNVTKPDQNSRYPDSIKASGALRAFYDNCGEDETLALKIHKAVLSSKQDGFRGNLVKMRKIKAALYKLLKDEDEVERVYNIVVEQEEY